MLSHSRKREIAEAIRDEACRARGIQKLLCRGRCMVPVLDDTVEVLVRDCGPERLALGDIILYTFEGRLMLHRFIRTRKGEGGSLQIVTKADAALRYDPPIGPDDLIGKVVEIERCGKRVKIGRYLWPLSFRIAGALSCAEEAVYSMLYHLRTGPFSRLEVRPQYRALVVKAVRTPKILFTRATAALMRLPGKADTSA